MGKVDRIRDRARTASIAGDQEEAVSLFTQAISLSPNDADLYALRSVTKQKLGLLQEALDDCDIAISMNSKDDSFYFRRGDVRACMGDLAGAIEDFDAAIAIDSTYAVYRDSRAKAAAELAQQTSKTSEPNSIEADTVNRSAPVISPDGRSYWDGATWQPLPGSTSEPQETTLHEFVVDQVRVFPGGRRLLSCTCRITNKRVIVTDQKGNIQQALFSDMMGVELFGRLSPEVRMHMSTESLTLYAKRDSREIVRWIQEAIKTGS